MTPPTRITRGRLAPAAVVIAMATVVSPPNATTARADVPTPPALPALAAPPAPPRSYRIVDVGLRPLFSFPEALGLALEVHPLGGQITVEGGVGMSPVQSLTFNAAVKYRFLVHAGETLHASVGPGLGSHWFFERGYPVNGQLVTGFVASEAVWWGNRFGFRLALDVGIAYPVWDDPDNADLRTWPVFNSSVGVAFRTDAGRRASLR